jgi:hypothetical protein
MADHSTTLQGPETPDAFVADHQRFWSGFTHATLGVVIFIIVLLILMAVFLL